MDILHHQSDTELNLRSMLNTLCIFAYTWMSYLILLIHRTSSFFYDQITMISYKNNICKSPFDTIFFRIMRFYDINTFGRYSSECRALICLFVVLYVFVEQSFHVTALSIINVFWKLYILAKNWKILNVSCDNGGI